MVKVGSGAGGITTVSCSAVGAGGSLDVFKKNISEGEKALFHLMPYQIPPSLAFLILQYF